MMRIQYSRTYRRLASRARGPSSSVRARIPIFVSIIQAFLFLVHLAIYATWTFFWGAPDGSRAVELRIALAILSVSFVAASLLAHQYFNPLVRAVYIDRLGLAGLREFLFSCRMRKLDRLWRAAPVWSAS